MHHKDKANAGLLWVHQAPHLPVWLLLISPTPPPPTHLSPFNLDQRQGVGERGLRTSCIEMFNLAQGEVCIATQHPRCSLFVRASRRKEGRRERWWEWSGNGNGGRGVSCGNHGDGLYCIIPHHWAPGDRGCPHRHLERPVLPPSDKTRSLIHDEPHPDRCNKGWAGGQFVALHFARTAGFSPHHCCCFHPEPKRTHNVTWLVLFSFLLLSVQGRRDEMLYNVCVLGLVTALFFWTGTGPM